LSDIAATYPYVDQHLIGDDIAYPAMMRFLPAGFLGFVVAGTLAAYRSTVETHLNWGTSYLVHDFYRRFLRPAQSERHYVFVGRLVTAGLMLVAALTTYLLGTAREAFSLILSIGAGTGLLYLMRWYWWRITAWSEISAMLSSFIVAAAFFIARKAGYEIAETVSLLTSVAVTTVVWVAVTIFGPETDPATLERFYQLTRPAGPGWSQIRTRIPTTASSDSLTHGLLSWVFACTFVYSALFGTGSWLYGRMPQFWLCLTLCIGSGFATWRSLRGHRT
jgi:Na+/proline symporter